MVATHRRQRVVAGLSVLVLALAVAAVTLTAVNRTTDSDPMGSLLVSESIVNRHTVFLDGYYPDVLRALSTRVESVGDRPAYMFPIGTSLVAVPVVWALGAFGITVVPHDHEIQIGLAVLAAVLTVILLYLLARRFLGPLWSLALSAAFWFGTALSSTGATALWSHDFGVVFSLLSLILLVRVAKQRSVRALVALPFALTAAIVIRPQLALLAVGCVVVLVVLWWRASLALLGALAVLAGLLLVVNQLVTGQWVPGYYLPQRLSGGDFWAAISGNLVSPARGFLVYTPVLLALPLLAWARGRLGREDLTLVLLGLTWPVAHVIAISRFPHWWGGWGFGARLMMDVIPGVFLATVILWPAPVRTARARVAVLAAALLAAFGIWVNTVQGLYNPYTRFWYVEPNVDSEPDNVWDWTYPQFLASEAGHEDRLTRALSPPPAIQPGVAYPPEAPELGFIGWSTGFVSPGISLDTFQLGPSSLLAEDGRRWTEGGSAQLHVTLTPEARASLRGSIRMSADLLGAQRVEMTVNGQPVYDSLVGPDRAILVADFDPAILKDGRNVIRLSLPDAASVGEASDYRVIALALKQFTIE